MSLRSFSRIAMLLFVMAGCHGQPGPGSGDAPPKTPPVVAVAFEAGALRVVNKSGHTIYYWGADAADTSQHLGLSAEFINDSAMHDLPADLMSQWVTRQQGNTGKPMGLQLYLSDASHQHYLGRCDVTVKLADQKVVAAESGPVTVQKGGW